MNKTTEKLGMALREMTLAYSQMAGDLNVGISDDPVLIAARDALADWDAREDRRAAIYAEKFGDLLKTGRVAKVTKVKVVLK